MIPAEDIGGLIWSNIDGAKLDELLSGCKICGSEPIDYPNTDGVLIYIKDKKGDMAVLEIGEDPDEENSFYMRIAKLPERRH